MGLWSRVKSVWYAILNKSVGEMEDKHVVALAEAKLQEATERLKDGRQGLISYQALVYKVNQQVEDGRSHIAKLTEQIKVHLHEGNESVAGQLAVDLQQLREQLIANEEQLGMHQEAYENNLLKMKSALKDIQKTRKELETKKAALQMEKALSEVAEAAGALNTSFDVSTDLGQVLGKLDDQLNQAKARTKVASDLSGQEIERLKAKASTEKAVARDLLEQFKIEEGLAEAPPTSDSGPQKTVGPERTRTPESQ